MNKKEAQSLKPSWYAVRVNMYKYNSVVENLNILKSECSFIEEIYDINKELSKYKIKHYLIFIKLKRMDSAIIRVILKNKNIYSFFPNNTMPYSLSDFTQFKDSLIKKNETTETQKIDNVEKIEDKKITKENENTFNIADIGALKVNKHVYIIKGIFSGYSGIVQSIDAVNSIVVLDVTLDNNITTSIDLSFSDIEINN